MAKLGESPVACSRCRVVSIHSLLHRCDGGDRLCRRCIDDLWNRECGLRIQAREGARAGQVTA